jgi:hypothetical protein
MSVSIKFHGTKNCPDSTTLDVFVNNANEITVNISCLYTENEAFISLDRRTAIKLRRELGKQISLSDLK